MKKTTQGRVQDQDMEMIFSVDYRDRRVPVDSDRDGRVSVEEFLDRVQRSTSLRIVSSDLLHLQDALSEGVSCMQNLKHLRDVILLREKLN